MKISLLVSSLLLAVVVVSGAPCENDSSSPACSCGTRNTFTRVVNGHEADTNEYPWIASIRMRSSKGHFCGGSIIAKRWILSAAHCFTKNSAAEIYVTVGGRYIYTNYDIDSAQNINVAEIYNHGQYDDSSKNNDMALLKLEEDINFNQYTGPVCLPYGDAGKNFDGNSGTVMGWGTTSYGGYGSPALLEANIPVLSTDSCKKIGWMQYMINDNMICTYEVGKDTCQGDSGGPLSIEYKGKFVEVGVVSFGKGCASENWPGVYAKVANYLSWIESTTGEVFCQNP